MHLCKPLGATNLLHRFPSTLRATCPASELSSKKNRAFETLGSPVDAEPWEQPRLLVLRDSSAVRSNSTISCHSPGAEKGLNLPKITTHSSQVPRWGNADFTGFTQLSAAASRTPSEPSAGQI